MDPYKLNKLSEEAFRKYAKRINGFLPGPSSLYEHGFQDGIKYMEDKSNYIVTYRCDVEMPNQLGVFMKTDTTSDKRLIRTTYEELVKAFGVELVHLIRIDSTFSQDTEEIGIDDLGDANGSAEE